MRGIFLIAGMMFAALAGTPSFAADMPLKAPPLPPAAVYNWSGVYAGINGGYDLGSSSWNDPFGNTSGIFRTDGYLVGGTVGANFRTNAIVFGVEADLDDSTLKGSFVAKCANPVPPETAICQTSNSWLGTARGRVGFVADRFLLFVTAGGAVGNVQANITGCLPPGCVGGGSNNTTRVGWTGGGGVEFALTQNWSAKVEYLYVDLANGSCTTACAGGNIAVTFNESLMRLGVNYKFDWGPVVTKY